MLWHLTIVELPKYENLVIEGLQLVEKGTMLFLHLCNIDGISYVWRQPIILLVFPGSVIWYYYFLLRFSIVVAARIGA